MQKLLLSSGDLVADRRADYAGMLHDGGDHSAAADLMRDALALVPGWAAGWYLMGEMHSAAGSAAQAADAWRETLRLDPADRLGAGLKLELAGAIGGDGAIASGFVEALFDQYAGTFDVALTERLGYRVPDGLADAIVRTGRSEFAHALDLGCGTGLMGERLRRMASFLEGIDISAGMLAKAGAKGIYDVLERRDLLQLDVRETKVDLVTAADVFLYLGRLERILAVSAGLLSQGGLLAFSVELHRGSEETILRESRRYAHSRPYVESVLAQTGFETVSIETLDIRQDRGEPIEGLLVVAIRRQPEFVVGAGLETMEEPAPVFAH